MKCVSFLTTSSRKCLKCVFVSVRLYQSVRWIKYRWGICGVCCRFPGLLRSNSLPSPPLHNPEPQHTLAASSPSTVNTSWVLVPMTPACWSGAGRTLSFPSRWGFGDLMVVLFEVRKLGKVTSSVYSNSLSRKLQLNHSHPFLDPILRSGSVAAALNGCRVRGWGTCTEASCHTTLAS